MAADKRCLVAVCHNGPVVLVESAMSLMGLGWGDRVADAKAAHGFSAIDFFWSTHWPRVDALRDSAVTLAQKEGFSHLLFLDADMKWPTDVLRKMLAHHDRGIVGGTYFLKGKPWAPVAMKGHYQAPGSQVDQWYQLQEYEKNAVLEVDILGMGCTLIPMAVFEAIGPRPWFEYALDDDGWPRVTEDVPFCKKAKAAGFSLWLDTSVQCDHGTTMFINHEWHERYQHSVKETDKRLTVTVHESTTGVEV